MNFATILRAAVLTVLLASGARLRLSFLAIALAASASAAAAAPIPVETIFKKQQYGDAVLSPSGRYLAVVTPIKDRQNLAVIDLEANQSNAVTTFDETDVLSVTWLTDQRLVITYGELDRASGETARTSGILAIDRDGKNDRDVRRGFTLFGGIVRVIPGTDEVFVSGSEREISRTDLYQVNTRTSSRKRLSIDTPGRVSTWVLDFDNVVRAIVTTDIKNDSSAWYVRKDENSPWVLGEESKQGVLPSTPVAFNPDGKTLYVRSRIGDRSAIYEYDIGAARIGEAIIQHAERDIVGNFVVDLYARRLLGFRYADDRPAIAWFDADYKRVQQGVDAALKDTVNRIARARHGDRWLVTTYSDRDPGSAYLLDGKTFTLQKVFDYRPGIKPAEMAEQRWVRYPARDGRMIPALLTVPQDAAGKRVPLVVDIHGGPYVPAETWGYQPDTQFFASRGYAVLQPQFRGTDGFGKSHFTAGFRQWGEAMQDDLVDGVAWAVKEGLVDKDRVCYFGGSYGGYAALWGAIRDREVIKCSVAFIAVSSIDYLFDLTYTDNASFMDRSENIRVRVGDPDKDRARWKAVNPLDNAQKVGVPILLAYGISDRRVPLVHGKDFRAALDKYGKPYEWVAYAGEGHGFNKSENVFDFYRRVEAFLARYLGKP